MAPEPPFQPPRRRCFQFSLRFLFVGLTVVCVLLGFEVRRYNNQKNAVDELTHKGATVQYAHQFDERGWHYAKVNSDTAKPTAPRWLRKILGDQYFVHMVTVTCRGPQWTDADADLIAQLPWLQSLSISGGRITDEAVKSISGCKLVRRLDLSDTRITDASIDYMKQMPDLDDIDISRTDISGEGWRQLYYRFRCDIRFHQRHLFDDYREINSPDKATMDKIDVIRHDLLSGKLANRERGSDSMEVKPLDKEPVEKRAFAPLCLRPEMCDGYLRFGDEEVDVGFLELLRPKDRRGYLMSRGLIDRDLETALTLLNELKSLRN